ncbi:MAG TPA: phage integrase SAM-like domain-containing protein [Ruminiclostridium sp.]
MAVISMKNKKKGLTLETVFGEFIVHSKAKALKPTTISNYQNYFKRFTNWYTGEVGNINENVLNQYSIYLQSQISFTSVNSAMRHLKAIFNYFTEQGYMSMPKIKFLKGQEKHKETFTDEEIMILLKKPNKSCEFQEFRTCVVINFFCATGCRVGTLASIMFIFSKLIR